MKAPVLLFLSCLSLCAQSPLTTGSGIDWTIAQTAAATDFVQQQGTNRFYWNWSDLTNGITVSNQWTDRIQGAHLWMMNTTKSPTNSSTKGVRFQGAQQLTNVSITYGVGNLNTGTVFMVFSVENAASFPPLASTADGGTVFGTFIEDTSKLGYNGGNGERSESSALPGSTNIDVILTLNNGSVSFYTNGALSKTDATAGTATSDSWGNDTPAAERLIGWMFVYAFYSNIISSTSISNLHWWRTNAALSGIGGWP